MEQHLEKLENDVAAIKIDVAIILSNYATKADIARLRSDLRKAAPDLRKWRIATLIGLFIGFAGLLITTSDEAPAPVTQGPPINITIQVPVVPGR